MNTTARKLILLVAVAVSLALLSSVLFVGFSAGHVCTTHEHCAVCCHISTCVNMLRSMAMAISILAIVMAARSAVLCAVFQELSHYIQTTLVSNKVKLSN